MKQRTKYAWLLPITVLILTVVSVNSPAFGADLLQRSGKLTLFRVNALGSGYGPPRDRIDAEVIVKLDSATAFAFGLRLRDESDRHVRQAMTDLLREAYWHDWTVTIDYWLDPGKTNGLIHRVWVRR